MDGMLYCFSSEEHPLRKQNFITKNDFFFSDKNANSFHISAQNINCGYSLEPPRRDGSCEYPQSIFLSRIRKLMNNPVNPSFSV